MPLRLLPWITGPLFLLLAAVVAAGNPLAEADRWLAEQLHALRHPAADSLLIPLTSLGDSPSLLGLTLLLAAGLWLGGSRRLALLWSGGFVINLALHAKLKLLFAIPRPEYLLQPLPSFSFPSGHSSDAAYFWPTLAWLLCRMRPQHGKLWLAGGVLMMLLAGFSRLYLGVHWLTDVTGGFLLGGTLALAFMRLGAAAPVPSPDRRTWLVMLLWAVGYLSWRLPHAFAAYQPLSFGG